MDRRYPDSYLAFRVHLDLDGSQWICTVRAECVLNSVQEKAELSPQLAALGRVATPGRLPGGAGDSSAPPSQRNLIPGREYRPDALALGTELFQTIFRGRVRDLYIQGRQYASDRGCGLRIELVLQPDSPLNSLPWELLHSPEDSYLGTDPTTPIVRCPAIPRRDPAEPGWRLLRLLIVAADADGLPPLGFAEEIAGIEDACRRYKVTLVRAPTSEPRALRQLIRDGNFDAIHFMGHAELDGALAVGRLILAGEDRRPRRLAAEVVAAMVAARLPSLVVINACSSALARPGGGAFSGLASALFQAGVPAVVGMQAPIADRSAILFGGTFYEVLAQDRPVEAAVTEARFSLYQADSSDPGWATPVLFLPGSFGDPARTGSGDSAGRERQRLLRMGRQQVAQWEEQIEKPYIALRAEAVPGTNLDTAHAARGNDPFRRRAVTSIDPVLRRDPGPLLLIGPPGSGKTQTLLKAACDLTAAEQRRVDPRVVVLVRLGEFHVEGQVPEPHHVDKLVRRFCPGELRSASSDSPPTFEELRQAGRLVVLFDGLDEMSREGYNDHLRALSLFATDLATLGGRCIFTCRVEDVISMPGLKRYSLLPFDRPQIDRYLRRQFPDRRTFPARGERWRPGRLARYLAADSPHLEAGNPLNLSLIAKFIASRDLLPDSRAELFQEFFQSRYASRVSEEELGAREAFHGWARLAWWISERNLGTTIDAASLCEDASGAGDETSERVIRAGILRGVLREKALAGKERQLWFRQRQAQEYFAARWIHETGVVVDWSTRLDDSRWQEILFHLVAMGGGEEGLVALAVSMTDTAREREARAADAADEKPPPPSSAEAGLADRVALGARLARQLGPGSAAGRRLRPPLLDAVKHLAVRGNPATQVKMLKAWRALDDPTPALGDPALATAVKTAERSPVPWVRDQAVLLTADLPGEMGVDLATAELMPRWRVFRRSVYSGGGAGDWLALIVATLLGVAHLAAMLALSLALSSRYIEELGDWEREAKEPVLLHLGPLGPKGFLLLQAGLTLGVLLFALVSRPRRAWLWCFGTVPLGCAAGYAALALSQSNSDAIGLAGVLALTLAIGLPAIVFGSALLHLAVLATYSLTLPRRAGRPGLAELMGIAWRDCGYGATITGFFSIGLLSLLVGGAQSGAQSLVEWLIDQLFALAQALYEGLRAGYSSFAQAIPVGPPLAGLIALGLLTVSLLLPAVRRRLGKVVLGLTKIVLAVGCLTVVAAGIALGEPVIDRASAWIVWVWARVPGTGLVAPAILLIVLLLLARVGLLRFLGWLRTLRRPEPRPPGSLTPEAWKTQLNAASPSEQKRLLADDHQSMGLSRGDFLRLFEAVDPLVKQPARSFYWQRRNEVERAARQEQGSCGQATEPSTSVPPP